MDQTINQWATNCHQPRHLAALLAWDAGRCWMDITGAHNPGDFGHVGHPKSNTTSSWPILMYHDVSLFCKEPQYHLGHRFSEPTMQDLGGRQVCQVLKSTVEAQPRFIHPWSLSSRPNCSPMQFYSLACNKLQRYNWRNPDSDSDPIHFDGSPNFKMPFF